MKPDAPLADAPRLKPLNLPTPLAVRVDARGWPRAVAVRRRWCPVTRIAEVWRLDDEWWRSRPLARLYFRVVLDGGNEITFYRELEEGSWWQQCG